jgi:hypothetical protein
MKAFFDLIRLALFLALFSAAVGYGLFDFFDYINPIPERNSSGID